MYNPVCNIKMYRISRCTEDTIWELHDDKVVNGASNNDYNTDITSCNLPGMVFLPSCSPIPNYFLITLNGCYQVKYFNLENRKDTKPCVYFMTCCKDDWAHHPTSHPPPLTPTPLLIWKFFFILPWICNHRSSSLVKKYLIHPFPNFNSATIEVWGWICNFIHALEWM